MFLKKKSQERSLLKIFSFYNQQVNPDVPVYQKAVFSKFGLSINHVFDKRMTHGDFMNQVCRNVTDTDYLVFFDIDCIPVHPQWLQLLFNDLTEPHTVAGAAQTANHLRNGENLYISPFFFGVSTAYLKELSYPDMKPSEDMDAGQNLTEHVLRNKGQVKYWWPSHIEEEKWNLYHPEHTRFGLGTTYNNAVYHAFNSRINSADSKDNTFSRFVQKCREVLGE